MSFLDVKSNLREARRQLSGMDKILKQATRSSINRATQRSKTELGRKIRERYVIKQSEATKTITVRKAGGLGLSSEIKTKGKTIPLINFSVNPKKRPTKPKMVRAAVLRGSQRKSLKRAFISNMGGHTGVFERVGKKRLPVRELRGPAVPEMANNEEVVAHVQEVYGDEMNKRMPHELNRLLGRL
ncbi:phage tail protein [Paenibacillus kribbensis]|uniref:phage tail protein n=1 Tax=Paenibacillus kribbensis TaxID=172713 RepID=UPI002DBD8361|nr:phage tail protein [Paenibacillus kribbensis]MEC0234070.1 phage tail protein [Paenibacillus kribbensis]